MCQKVLVIRKVAGSWPCLLACCLPLMPPSYRPCRPAVEACRPHVRCMPKAAASALSAVGSQESLPPEDSSPAQMNSASAELEARWGVQVQRVRRAAGGYLLDFRYKVVDPAKAVRLFDHGVQPYLIDQATGGRVAVPAPPKLGAMRRTGTPVAGLQYFIMFANPGQFIKPGNRVTVVIGDLQATDLVVE